MNYIFLDTETATLPDNKNIKKDEDILIQLAYIIVTNEKEIIIKKRLCKNNGIQIQPHSMSIHHITPEMVEGLYDIQHYEEYTFLKEFIQNNVCTVVAHNAPFDIDVLKRVGIDIERFCDIIDTLRVTKVLNDFQGLVYEQVTLQFLKYFYRLDLKRQEFNKKYNISDEPHNALSDVVDVMFYFKHLRQEMGASIQNLISISAGPNRLQYIPFGTNKGKRFTELSVNQLRWYKNECDDLDIKYSADCAS